MRLIRVPVDERIALSPKVPHCQSGLRRICVSSHAMDIGGRLIHHRKLLVISDMRRAEMLMQRTIMTIISSSPRREMVCSPGDVQLFPLTRVLEVLLSKHGEAPLSNQQTELVQAFAGQVGELDPLYFGAELGSDRTVLGSLQQVGE